MGSAPEPGRAVSDGEDKKGEVIGARISQAQL